MGRRGHFSTGGKPTGLIPLPTGTGYVHITSGVADPTANDYIGVGVTSGQIATTGLIRLPNNIVGAISFRNVTPANPDIKGLYVDNNNFLQLGSSGAVTAINGAQVNVVAGSGGLLAASFANSATPRFHTYYNIEFDYNATEAAVVFQKQQTANTVAMRDFPVTAQSAHAASTGAFANGGNLVLQGGSAAVNGTTGTRGGVRCQIGQDTAETMIECTEVAIGRRAVALCQLGSGVTTTQLPANTGDGVIYIANAGTAPTANAVGGGLLYCNAGALVYRGTSGTTTTLGPAEPHCPTCGRDFAVEWRNDDAGEHLAVCMPCLITSLRASGVDLSRCMIADRMKAP